MEHDRGGAIRTIKKHVAKKLSLTGVYIGGKKNIGFRTNLCRTNKNTIFVNCFKVDLLGTLGFENLLYARLCWFSVSMLRVFVVGMY